MDENELKDKLSQIINANYIEDEKGEIYIRDPTKYVGNTRFSNINNNNKFDTISFNNKLDNRDIPKIKKYFPTSNEKRSVVPITEYSDNNPFRSVEYSDTNPFNDNENDPLLAQENNSWRSKIKKSLKSKYDYINERIIKPIYRLTKKIKRRHGSWRRSHGGKTRKRKRSVCKKTLK